MNAYRHSDSFAALKGITETLTHNLTTSQYLQIYDECLDKAIIPIIESTVFFDSFITCLLGWQEKNFRRKVSFLNRHEIPRLVVNFLLQPTVEARIEAYKKLQLDRGIRIEFIKLFAERLDPYKQACNCELINPQTKKIDLGYCLKVKTSLEVSFRATSPLLAALLESTFWLEKTLAFKQIIVEKYVRLCLNNAQRDYVDYFDKRIPLDDLVQVYLMVASRAIDKCDSRQGTLTSHIQNWFKTGRSRVAQQHEHELATQSMETVNFEAQELQDYASDSAQERILEEREAQTIIRTLAKIADPLGAARAFLNIEETLSESELRTLFSNQSFGAKHA